MNVTAEELAVLRELARRYMDVAALEEQQEHISRGRDINDLKPDRRPIVLIDEIPWHEMDIGGELKCACADPFARDMEFYLRRNLFAWKYFKADMVVVPYYPLRKTIRSTGNGFTIDETILALDDANGIVSHEYHDQLKTETDLERFRLPVISTDEEEDARRVERAEELLGGILPVRLRGINMHFAPWDWISELRGVGPLLLDLADRPEFMHKVVSRMTDIHLDTLRQYEELGLLDIHMPLIHCTPAYTSNLPSPGFDGTHVRACDWWLRGTAQIFASVSPSMHDEFELQYASKLFEKCGLVYYGCCEPLDNKIHLLKRHPNMRKIGVSPWANAVRSAEQMGSRYVLSRKPNPANVAVLTNAGVVRAEIEETVKACIDHGTPCEFVLKDISTVSYRPQNLIDWERTVRETLDRFYK
jgi:hypothetical protein